MKLSLKDKETAIYVGIFVSAILLVLFNSDTGLFLSDIISNDLPLLNAGPAATYVSIDAIDDYACAVLENGNVNCWQQEDHLSGWEESAVVDYHGGDAVKVASGRARNCALLENGNVHCWGDGHPDDVDSYDGQDAIDIAMTRGGHACILIQNGNVKCWGNNYDGEVDPNSDSRWVGISLAYSGGDGVDISTGRDHSCVLKDNGDVHCWGDNNYGQSDDYLLDITESEPIKLDSGHYHNCILLQNGNVKCWGELEEDYNLGGMVDIASGNEVVCGILQNSTVHCWGRHAGADEFHTNVLPVKIFSGMFTRCAVLSSGDVECWGNENNDYNRLTHSVCQSNMCVEVPGPGISSCETPLDCNSVPGFCGDDICGNSPEEDLYCQDCGSIGAGLIPVSDIGLGSSHTCLVLQNGNVECYGDNDYGESENYDGGDAVQVDGGDRHTCVLRDNKNVKCYGDNSFEQSNDYNGRDVVSIDVGSWHNCALLEDGNVDCWGDEGYGGRAEFSYSGGDVKDFAAGWGHTCVLLHNGNVRCSGLNNDYQADPGSESSFVDMALAYSGGDGVEVSAGGQHTCVLRDNGNVKCWGDPSSGISNVDDYSRGDANKLYSGYSHNCVLADNGDVNCWENNNYGQSAGYSGGAAIAAAAGSRHSCALLINGNVDCWGDNRDGQSNDYITAGFCGDGVCGNTPGENLYCSFDCDINSSTTRMFIDTFNECDNKISSCGKAKTDLRYDYIDGSDNNDDWYASSQGAFDVKSARSGDIINEEESMLTIEVTLPETSGIYSLSFNYKVDAGPGDKLEVNMLQNIEVPSTPITGSQEIDSVPIKCFPGEGIEDTSGWRTFSRTNNPTSSCSNIPSGTHRINFVYSKDSSGTSQPDAAFIDNLEINLIPVA